MSRDTFPGREERLVMTSGGEKSVLRLNSTAICRAREEKGCKFLIVPINFMIQISQHKVALMAREQK